MDPLAYGLMSSSAASSPDVKQIYINGHFCHADKFAILTNGLVIVRKIVFLNAVFKAASPELPVEKKSDSPEDDKTIHDSATLKLILSDFFRRTPGIIQRSRCISFRDCQLVYGNCCFLHELLGVYPKLKTAGCLKKYSVIMEHKLPG